jgi:hypothetical protein
MPKTPIDYSKSVVYSITDLTNHEVLYIGSTTNFINRKWSHKTDAYQQNTKYYNIPIYIKIREIGLEYIDIKPIEEINCLSKNELLARERYWIEYYKPKYNSRKPIIFDNEKVKARSQSVKKWRDNNREHYNKLARNWRVKNKEHYNKYSKELRNWNCIKKVFLNILFE